MGTTTPTIDLRRSKVRVTQVDKETGEIIERVVPHKDFRPRAPRRPILDSARFALLPRRLQVLVMFAHREAEIAFWEFHANILTKEERAAFLHDDVRSVLRPIAPAWQPGDRMYVASNMEAEVLEVTEGVRGYGTVFKLIDWREILLKRSPGGGGKPETDEDGYAVPLTPTEQRRAELDGAYTTSPNLAVADAGAVMDEKAFERIHSDRDAANAKQKGKRKVTRTRSNLERRLAEAKARHRTSTVRYLERQLEALEEKAA